MMFKICKKCEHTWATRKKFLEDVNIELVGYQVHFQELTLGLFLFNHDCGTTLSVYANQFVDLYEGPIFSKRATGSKECPGYCLEKGNLSPCSVECECSYIREILQHIKTYKEKRR